jgi:hypothetical protein
MFSTYFSIVNNFLHAALSLGLRLPNALKGGGFHD